MKILLTALSLLLLGLPHAVTAQIWQLETSASARSAGDGAVYLADHAALRDSLARAGTAQSSGPMHEIELPLPDGRVETFAVVEAPIMAPELAARYPDIKSYRVYGVDDPNARGRVGISRLGLHGMIEGAAGMLAIERLEFVQSQPRYRSRWKRDVPGARFGCRVHDAHADLEDWLAPQMGRSNRVPGSLLEYGIAVAATSNYHAFFGSNPANTTIAIATTISNVNVVYERDLGISLVLVAGNDQLYDTAGTTLENEDVGVLLGQVDNWIDTNLPGGDGDYDIGHVLTRFTISAFGSGVAFLGAACDDAIKGSGVSGAPTPIGSSFDIDLVAHEIGHQFDAEHTFNGTTSSCGPNRVSATAYEPGSGSTIMAYAGICSAENLQNNSDATFHAGSIAQIDSFTGAGGSCGTPVAIMGGNADPALTAIANTTIPAETPFVLNVSGPTTDIDGDPLEYQWDQLDAGCPTDSTSFGTDNGSNALFRSYRPRTESWRNFPALGTQLGNNFDRAEVLACQDRVLDFRLTVRDGASGQDTEDVRLTVDSGSGPFAITAPNTAQTITSPGPITVSWNVAGTNVAPVSCGNVNIDLLTFSGAYATYSIHSLVAGTPNDGSHTFSIPPALAANTSPVARIRVKCSNNFFYDLSNADLVVNGTDPTPIFYDNNDFTTRSNLGGTLTGSAPVCGPVVDCSPPPVIDPNAGRNDATAVDWRLLALLLALFGVRARRA